MNRICRVVCACYLMHGGLSAAEVDFIKDVRPILQMHCFSCHGPETSSGGLRLDIKSEAFEGGDGWGPSLVPGEASESPLIELVSSDDPDSRMPPDDQPLSADQIRILTQWIDEGADWPDDADSAEIVAPLDHWSFKPLMVAKIPEVRDAHWPRSSVDCYVLEGLAVKGLSPAPDTEAVAWLRRVAFDLTGLPPTEQEVDDFLAILDKSGDGPGGDIAKEHAYVTVVDRLLNSPRYGERYAQHWLDVVRYADTHGFEVNTERPNAWPYRDYVIDAFNRDTPYDRFVEEQIAGDALGADAATGFLVTASALLPGQIGKDGPSIRLARQDSIDEMVNNLGQTFLGLSIGCARCHDHKFDPISAKDYYSMQAFVAGVDYGDRELRTDESDAQQQIAATMRKQVTEIEQQLIALEPLARPLANPDQPPAARRATVFPEKNVDRFDPVRTKRLRFTIIATNSLEPCIDELEVFDTDGSNIALAQFGTTVTTSGDNINPDRHEPRFINDGQYGNSRSWMSNEPGKGWVEFEFPDEHEIDHVIWGRDRTGEYLDRLPTEYKIETMVDNVWMTIADSTDRKPWVAFMNRGPRFVRVGLSEEDNKKATHLLHSRSKLEAAIKATEKGSLVFAGTFRKPDEIHLLRRGDPEQPQRRVAPAVPSAIGNVELPLDSPEQDRRLALANWIVDPQNPLTARVMVNRIWQWHFGTGIVDTPNDFGLNGTKPTHPELLDWLAIEFIRSGWSIKHMHRLIVLSSTYRQSTQFSAEAASKDANSRFLWRFPSRRIEAEAIRDAMLAVSGVLNLTTGGRGFNLFEQRGGLSGFTPVESFAGDGLRRMIYAHKVRRERDAVFGAFDCPDAGQSTSRRIESTTPIQSLNLMNSRFTIEQASAFASRIEAEESESVADQIRHAYKIALNREPLDYEVSEAESVVRGHGLETLCRVIFNSNEFLFLP